MNALSICTSVPELRRNWPNAAPPYRASMGRLVTAKRRPITPRWRKGRRLEPPVWMNSPFRRLRAWPNSTWGPDRFSPRSQRRPRRRAKPACRRWISPTGSRCWRHSTPRPSKCLRRPPTWRPVALLSKLTCRRARSPKRLRCCPNSRRNSRERQSWTPWPKKWPSPPWPPCPEPAMSPGLHPSRFMRRSRCPTRRRRLKRASRNSSLRK